MKLLRKVPSTFLIQLLNNISQYHHLRYIPLLGTAVGPSSAIANPNRAVLVAVSPRILHVVLCSNQPHRRGSQTSLFPQHYPHVTPHFVSSTLHELSLMKTTAISPSS